MPGGFLNRQDGDVTLHTLAWGGPSPHVRSWDYSDRSRLKTDMGSDGSGVEANPDVAEHCLARRFLAELWHCPVGAGECCLCRYARQGASWLPLEWCREIIGVVEYLPGWVDTAIEE